MIRRFVIVFIVLGLAVFTYSQVMLRLGSGTPPDMAPADQQADLIEVNKSDRIMILSRDGDEIARYRIALGAAPEGHKVQEGDERTPEGRYIIDWRNANSIAHLSLHISYPNETDQQAAADLGVDPGGNIMIHGIVNGWGWAGWLLQTWDWTNGCIAVRDGEMREIWALVPNGTPIVIRP